MSALDELSPASFKGVPFQVEVEDATGSRALAVHEYAAADRWDTHDRGLKASGVKVTAYVASMEGVRAQSYAVVQACVSPGPGMLVLPHSPPQMAWAVDWRRSLNKERLGYIGFEISFTYVAPASVGVSPLLLPSQAAAGFSSLVSAIGARLS